MNKHFNDAIERVRELPEDRQEAAAVLLLDFLKGDDYELTPDQVTEVRRRLEIDDIVTEREAGEFLKRLTK